MRYAVALGAPVQCEKPEANDDAKAKAVPGVLAIPCRTAWAWWLRATGPRAKA
jgi:hypothetical protein